MSESASNGWRERMDRAERAIAALADSAAEHYARMATQQERVAAEHAARMNEHAARMAEHAVRMAEIEARHTTRLNEHEDAILDVEAEHRRLLKAQVSIAEILDRVGARLDKLAIANEEQTEKLNALIHMMDEWIRRNPRSTS